MNEYDRDQLNFIMSLDDEAFNDWATAMADDDIKYAIELIQAARLENAILEQELLEALEDSDLAEANAVLSKFRL